MTAAAALDSWIACRKRRPQARLRLFCFPYAGGNAVNFRSMAGALRDSGLAVYAVELPGHDLAGQDEPADIIRSVPKGLYAVNFGGGQVDITSGRFVFSASEAYLIEGGRIGRPVRGATLIGNGPDARAMGAPAAAASYVRLSRRMRESTVARALSTTTSQTRPSPSVPERRSAAVRCSALAAPGRDSVVMADLQDNLHEQPPGGRLSA